MLHDTHPATKVILNRSPGVFSLSKVAIEKLLARKGNVVDLRNKGMHTTTESYRLKRRPVEISHSLTIDRADSDLVFIVEELGSLASGPEAELEVVIIPENLDWSIGDVCGIEFIFAGEKVWPTKEVDSNEGHA
jgi:hypothetical protein